MAARSEAQAVLRGRFPAGTSVELVQVKDASVLRSAGGKVVASQTVSEDGEVRFSGVEDGQRYFIRGYVDGFLREARITGRSDADAAFVGQPPVQPDPQRLAGGGVIPTERTDAPGIEVQPAVRQDQVPEDVLQRSDTPLGAGTPILDGEDEVLPHARQEDTGDDVVQRSATETGQATPVGPLDGLGQQDAPEGLLQRSDTPYGALTPIPEGDAVDATAAVQSPDAKAQGHPVVGGLGQEPAVAEGNSALNALSDPDGGEEAGPNATDDQSGRVPNSATSLAGGEDDGPLTGKALDARAAELDVAGRASMTADEKREAVAKAEKS